MNAGAGLDGGGRFCGLYSVAWPFPSHPSLPWSSGHIHWYHTWVRNTNKTDVIKIGCARSSVSPSLLLFYSKENRRTRTANNVVDLFIHSPPLSFALRLSFDFSSFHLSPCHTPGPWGCKASLSTEAELSKLNRQCRGEEQEADTS